MDIQRERVTDTTGRGKTYLEEISEQGGEDNGDAGLDSDEKRLVLAEIDSQDIDEYQVPQVLAEVKRKTWAQNK